MDPFMVGSVVLVVIWPVILVGLIVYERRLVLCFLHGHPGFQGDPGYALYCVRCDDRMPADWPKGGRHG